MFVRPLLVVFICSTGILYAAGVLQIAEKKMARTNELAIPNWNDNLHRLQIILALEGKNKEIQEIEESLDKALTNALLRNISEKIPSSELALWVNALITKRINPRNYRGIDLVSDLMHRVKIEKEVKPFIILTLCNSHSLNSQHLVKLTTVNYVNASNLPRDIEKLALALKALSCAASLPYGKSMETPKALMEQMAAALAAKQNNGQFGSLYTTSLAVQALTAYGKQKWDESTALEFMRKESETITSVVKSYYISMASNARRVAFLKDLYHGSYDPAVKIERVDISVSLSIKYEDSNVEFGMTLRVPDGLNLFEIMLKAGDLSARMKISYSKDKDGDPIVYEVDSIPNDPERELTWILCSNRYDNPEIESPARYAPTDKEHIILLHTSSKDCPVKEKD